MTDYLIECKQFASVCPMGTMVPRCQTGALLLQVLLPATSPVKTAVPRLQAVAPPQTTIVGKAREPKEGVANSEKSIQALLIPVGPTNAKYVASNRLASSGSGQSFFASAASSGLSTASKANG